MSNRKDERAAEILLVEDNEADARLTREALAEDEDGGRLHVVCDGVEAMAFLRREGRYADAPRPDVILLDLNLPRMDGREVLSQIKADEQLRSIPVVVLTSSTADEDIARSYGLHANGYVSKPLELDRFFEAIQATRRFWLDVASLPPKR